jgi:hypothetical protein
LKTKNPVNATDRREVILKLIEISKGRIDAMKGTNILQQNGAI